MYTTAPASRIWSDAAGRDHELVRVFRDDEIGYVAIVAIHSTRRGPATGGTRLACYDSEADALMDVLRLSKAMSYKAALADLPAGGGKSVILANRSSDRASLIRAHARSIHSMGGSYITAVDVGTTPADLDMMAMITPHVSRHRLTHGGGGTDTASGVMAAMRGAAVVRWGQDSLAGRRVAVQGAGNVGAALCRMLRDAGASVVVSDTLPERAERIAREVSGAAISAEDIHACGADVFAPCAMGASLDHRTIARLGSQIVVGAANNQLENPDGADEMFRRGILYVPDYVANAGGMIAGVGERNGFSLAEIQRRIAAIRATTMQILRESLADGIPTSLIADRMAETLIRHA